MDWLLVIRVCSISCVELSFLLLAWILNFLDQVQVFVLFFLAFFSRSWIRVSSGPRGHPCLRIFLLTWQSSWISHATQCDVSVARQCVILQTSFKQPVVRVCDCQSMSFAEIFRPSRFSYRVRICQPWYSSHPNFIIHVTPMTTIFTCLRHLLINIESFHLFFLCRCWSVCLY